MKTKERLAMALRDAGAPSGMIRDALDGQFDDFESDSPMPILDLIAMAEAFMLYDIVRRAKGDEWSCTEEEARAWAERQTDPETIAILKSLDLMTSDEVN